MGAWRTGVGAFCALVVAVLLVSDPALAASRFRRNEEEVGPNCKKLKLQSQTCIDDAHAEFTKSMENEKAPESDVCTNKVCDYMKAIEECYTHLDSCENEDENKKDKFQEIIQNDDCKSLNIEVCPIMKAFVDDNPVVAKTLEGECDYECEMAQDTIEAGDQDDANEGNQDGDAAPEGNTEDVQSSNEGEGAKSEDVPGKAGEDYTDDNDQNNENDGDDVDDDDHDHDNNGDHEDNGIKDTDERNKDGNKNADEENNVKEKKEKKEKNADEVNNFKEKKEKKEKNNNDKGNNGKDTIILSTSLLFITLIFSFYLPE